MFQKWLQITLQSIVLQKNWLRSIARKLLNFSYCAVWSMGQGKPIAHYANAIGSGTATRAPHGNKLLSKNSFYLIIFNNLIILCGKVQILAF